MVPSRSDWEVHAQHALLPDLQLRRQDHPRAAVALHALPLPAPGRVLHAQPPRARHRRRAVTAHQQGPSLAQSKGLP